jgi:MoaA/NifB/PqqE/SkfB family radical SAM enzyme
VSVFARILRHGRLSLTALSHRRGRTPPFLTVYMNSICNLTCEHCYYWRNLNQRDDLTVDELAKLSAELGKFENLNLSGGEPFIRSEFAEVCALFIRNNGVRQIYVPTSGYFTDRTEKALRKVLQEPGLRRFVCEISLDGMPEYHNRFRGSAKSFDNAMATYDMLARLQREDERLRIHSSATASHENIDELRRLTRFLYDRCPAMEHHTLGMIRGDRKNPALTGPSLERYTELYHYMRSIWNDREQSRFGGIVEPMLQWAKLQTVVSNTQYVPCTAGNMTGVVYANGDVSVCESHTPIGNLRRESFFQIWESPRAQALRESIRAKQCHCTGEIAMWPSVVFQPLQLARAAWGSKLWQRVPTEAQYNARVSPPARAADPAGVQAVPLAFHPRRAKEALAAGQDQRSESREPSDLA